VAHSLGGGGLKAMGGSGAQPRRRPQEAAHSLGGGGLKVTGGGGMAASRRREAVASRQWEVAAHIQASRPGEAALGRRCTA
jgi:hypothetical protein